MAEYVGWTKLGPPGVQGMRCTDYGVMTTIFISDVIFWFIGFRDGHSDILCDQSEMMKAREDNHDTTLATSHRVLLETQ